jgi:flagellar basal-body rod protein FlgB
VESKGVFNQTVGLLERSLDLRSLRHSLITSNIANMDTPNYKAFDLIIEDELRKANEAETGNRRAEADLVEEEPSVASALFPGADGNTVDVDREMAKLSENSLMYNAMAQILSKKLSSMQNAIQGSGR